MAGEMEDDDEYEIKFREDEELEFFTELAVHETERWIQVVTKKTFPYPEDPRKSLENGILLCELANCILPGSVRRINRLSTPIAGLDNINVFIRACKSNFGLNETHLFDPSDLEDLSQRAIGDSDRLKGEYDKRLRNVAVTIYWLGRYAAANYQGPQLDQSAFSALIHHKHDAEILERDFRHSSSSSSATWDWSHVGQGANYNNKGSNSQYNARDGSVDSFGKESVDSLEDSVSPSRYSNVSATARGSDRDFPMSQSSNMHPSSNRHYSSTDSLDGSAYSGHSRQDSDNAEPVYATRRMSTQMTRRPSSSVDPLQYIKGKSATDLAEMAEVQMRIAAESKKIVTDTKVVEEDPVDWQANLSTWKSRRKSQSAVSYQLKEDLEKMDQEKEGVQTSVPVTKTFSQMQEERERRKSVSRHFYPIEDDDDNIFSPPEQTNPEKAKEEVLQSIHKPKAEVAPWARNSPVEEDKLKKDDGDNNEDDDGESGSESNDSNNNDKENMIISSSRNNSALHSVPPPPSRDWKTHGSDQSSRRTQSTQPQNNISSHSRHNFSDSQRNDSFKSSGTNVGPRTQNKIGSLMQNFQQAANKTTLPKEGYKENIDLSARKNIFEQFGNDSSNDKTSYSRDVKRYNDAQWEQDDIKNHNSFLGSQPNSKSSEKRVSPSYGDYEDDGGFVQVEKTIKISQKPNNDKGFGFFLTGGADQGRPLCVSKVSLGSAADLCELKVKDEILKVNQTDARDKTAGEVGDVIGRAVSTGFIELQVKRTCAADEVEEEEEDMTSSSDEGEEDLATPDPKGSRTDPPNLSSRYDYSQKPSEPTSDQAMDKIEVTTMNVAYSAPAPENYESKESGNDGNGDGPPAFLRKWQRQRQREEYTFDSGPSTDYSKISLNAGIPRQASNDRMEISQSSSVNYSQPSNSWDNRLDDWTKKQDQERQRDASPSSQGANGQAQFDARQEEIRSAFDESMNLADKKADERIKQEQTFLQPEMDKARILEERRAERRNRIQETAAALSAQPAVPASSSSSSLLSSSPSSSFSNLPLPSSFLPPSASSSLPQGTRRWQRSNSPLDPVNSDSAPPPVPAVPTSGSHVTSISFDIGNSNNSNRINSNASIAPSSSSYALPRQDGVVVIDPRNMVDKQQPMAPLEFQVKLPPKPDDQNSLSFLEAERERIRQEERRKVEEERMREQREWEAKQEELRKMEEKERELREKEEMLRLEREKFQREQEEFLRLREQQLKEQQQQQQQPQPQYQGMDQRHQHYPIQQQQPQPLQQQQQHQQPQQQQHQQPQQLQQQQYQPQHHAAPPPQASHSIYQNIYPSSQQFENYHQHMSQFKDPQQVGSDSNNTTSSQQTGIRSASPSYYQGNAATNNGQPSSSYSKPSWNSNQPPERPKGYRQVGGNAYSQVQPPPPSSSEQERYRRDEPVAGGRFSREDMLAMNRKATQDLNVSRKSPENHYPQQQQQQHQQHHFQPQQQQQQQRVPSPSSKDAAGQPKGHALNSAPKARLRDDSEWQDPNRQVTRVARGGREDGNQQPRRSPYGNSQEHWLIQEAERRRMAESDSRIRGQPPPVNPGQVLFPGPIKAQNDEMGNRWRNNADTSPSMPRAIRQTLLLKTSTTRGPEASPNSNYPGDPMSPPLPPPPPPHHQQHYQPQHQQPMMSQQQQQQQHQLPRSLSPRSNNPYQAGSSNMPGDSMNRYSPNSSYPPPPSNLQQGPLSQMQGEGGLPVNGNQLCSHCNQELGFGAAMVIESLGIFFHLQCFRCCVCHASLGTGAQGADVRVRMNKLHCPNCYSNDEAGLKFSKV